LPHRSFPFEAVRDLVGLLRALYLAERALAHPARARLAAIKGIAEELQAATRMAAPHDPGTAPYERALAMADAATRKLGSAIEDRVGAAITLGHVLRGAARRVRGEPVVAQASEREIRWAVGKQRR
jgi:hypothetical protein